MVHAPEEGGYFAMLPHLLILQAQVNEQCGPSGVEIIRMLEQEAAQGGINPIAAHCQGKIPDEYLQAFPEILKLEAQLIQRIHSTNVSEIFQLIKETEFYKPTQPVIHTIRDIFREKLNQSSLNTTSKPQSE